MLPREFFQRDPLTCARDLIGCQLLWNECRGEIVETEAYAEFGDEACHSFLRQAARDFITTHIAGTAYVYQNYGIHWLLNVLVKSEEGNGFVLIRALEPTHGLELMRSRRNQRALGALCSGPGKLTVALGIGRSEHGSDLCSSPTKTFAARAREVIVESDLRVGITRAAHFPWRFLKQNSPFVSVRKRHKKPEQLP